MITRLLLVLLLSIVRLHSTSGSARSRMPFDYDIAVFSPSGELKQVQYATIAARKGNPVLCARNSNRCLVWIPRDPVESLYDTTHGPSFRKLQRIDSHAFAAFSGIAADGRVLVQHLREACQQYRRNFGSAKPISAIARDLAQLQFMHTTSMVSRPFGVQCIVVGADMIVHPGLGKPNNQQRIGHTEFLKRVRLFTTDPAGSVDESTCAAIGRASDEIMKSVADKFNGKELSARLGVDIIKPLLQKLKLEASSVEPEAEVDAYEMTWQNEQQSVEFSKLDIVE